MTNVPAPLPHERRDSGYARAGSGEGSGFAPVFGLPLVPALSGGRGREAGTAPFGTP